MKSIQGMIWKNCLWKLSERTKNKWNLAMINYLISENMKYRRTFSRKIIALAPMFFILYALFTRRTLVPNTNLFLREALDFSFKLS